MVIVGDDRARIESHIDRSGGPDTCHPWTGGQWTDGYGCVRIGGHVKGAHVAVWELENGPVPSAAQLDHECHNRAIRDGSCRPGKCSHRLCCNLSHIIMRASRKDHTAATPGVSERRFIKDGNAKLTGVQVREMRALLAGATGWREVGEIGRRYGISGRQAYRIKSGKSWNWL